LAGGVSLKDNQRLFGDPASATPPRVRATRVDAIVLGNGNEVAHLHLEVGNGAAIVADNASGTDLHDLRISRLTSGRMGFWDSSRCDVVVVNGVFDSRASVIRGCNSRLEPLQKAAITLLADGGKGTELAEHSIRRTDIRDISSDIREDLWAYGIDVQVSGDARVRVTIDDSSLRGMEGGIGVKGRQRGVLTVRVSDTSVDDILRDGIVVSTGFRCSGPPPDRSGNQECGDHPWVPQSDAEVRLYADGFRYADSDRRGLVDDASAIEFYSFDQGRSEIEIHAQDSDLIGAAQPAVFSANTMGYPARAIIDLGCRNPSPRPADDEREDRLACERAGYTSEGRNRIFGNAWGGEWSSPFSEVALVGPGQMMAQGNYWGDRAPPDGRGDVLGDCSRLRIEDGTPIHVVTEARCELWHVSGYADPTGIDGRFHLTEDPRP
jgi:hypothetical protein